MTCEMCAKAREATVWANIVGTHIWARMCPDCLKRTGVADTVITIGEWLKEGKKDGETSG